MDKLQNGKTACDKCSATFSFKKNLYAHLRKFHGFVGEKDPFPKAKCEILCNICGNTFAKKANLLRHMQVKHSTKIERSRKVRIQCPECNETLKTYSLFRDHLVKLHSIILVKEDCTFKSEIEFQQWKNKIQMESVSQYVLDSTTVTLSDGKRKRYYNCHRSHKYRSCGQGIKARKEVVSNKMGAACPARMEVLIENNCYSVQFWKTHVGHSIDVGRCFLTKKVRTEIAGKLKQGVTFQHILDEIRDSPGDIKSQRIQLLEKKDLHNITRAFNLQYSTKSPVDDAISVKLWVEDMKALREDCPVLYFKEQGKDDGGLLSKDDFCLIIMTTFQSEQLKKFGNSKICMDGTHGTNAYDFQLYTLMTVDKLSSGCPVAFCISNRVDEIIFKIFFEHIKLKIGCIETKIFMSDEAPAFYNAWSAVMTDVPNKLLCIWHVDRNWQKNLSKISGRMEIKAVVYKTLRILLQETCVEKFEAWSTQVVEDLLSKPNTRSFGEYFRSYYMCRAKEWAYCYRVGLGINTNMYLESLHRILKHIYLDGIMVKRLDKSIQAIMSLARDTMFKRLVKVAKNKLADHIKAIKQAHTASSSFSNIEIEAINDNEWLVASLSDDSKKYLVSQRETNCTNCLTICNECNICLHEFTCTCLDNIIKLNICKHIHACVRHTGQASVENINSSRNSAIEFVEVVDDNQKNNELVGPCHSAVIIHKSEQIIDLCANTLDITEEQSNSIIKKLDSIISALNKNNN